MGPSGPSGCPVAWPTWGRAAGTGSVSRRDTGSGRTLRPRPEERSTEERRLAAPCTASGPYTVWRSPETDTTETEGSGMKVWGERRPGPCAPKHRTHRASAAVDSSSWTDSSAAHGLHCPRAEGGARTLGRNTHTNTRHGRNTASHPSTPGTPPRSPQPCSQRRGRI